MEENLSDDCKCDLRKAIDYVIYGFEQHQKRFRFPVASPLRRMRSSKCKHMLHAAHFSDENLLLIERFSFFYFLSRCFLRVVNKTLQDEIRDGLMRLSLDLLISTPTNLTIEVNSADLREIPKLESKACRVFLAEVMGLQLTVA